ncbi:MAG: hypothetical protein WC088_00780 [Candidatus Izemoplasmatales bacterium]|nr:hypothetical protein [Candidatus Izemoplasmatales bacterium]MDD4595137.1 hypothetical protein [Candidatus Izemoplasmatales bacterium]
MKNDDKDLRKEIEDLEKLIAKVKQQNEEEKQKLKHSLPPTKRVVKINLGLDYSTDPIINLIVGFLINFILIFVIIRGLSLAETTNNYVYIILAALFTLYETIIKIYLFRNHQKLVIFSQGVIFFLANLIFFYLMDLVFMKETLAFVNYIYPMLFVFLFQLLRVIIKNLYALIIQKISIRLAKNHKSR